MELDWSCAEKGPEKMTVLLPLVGHLRADERRAALKRPGGGWWNWKREVQAGVHGTQHAVQPQTETTGGLLSKPCVPSRH